MTVYKIHLLDVYRNRLVNKPCILESQNENPIKRSEDFELCLSILDSVLV